MLRIVAPTVNRCLAESVSIPDQQLSVKVVYFVVSAHGFLISYQTWKLFVLAGKNVLVYTDHSTGAFGGFP